MIFKFQSLIIAHILDSKNILTVCLRPVETVIAIVTVSVVFAVANVVAVTVKVAFSVAVTVPVKVATTFVVAVTFTVTVAVTL